MQTNIAFLTSGTRSSATEKSTARPSWLVRVLYDISWEKKNLIDRQAARR